MMKAHLLSHQMIIKNKKLMKMMIKKQKKRSKKTIRHTMEKGDYRKQELNKVMRKKRMWKMRL